MDGPRVDLDDRISYQYYAADHTDCATIPANCRWRRGDLWKLTDAVGHVTETLRYDGAGRVLSVKEPDGVIADFEYHPRGWLTPHKIRGADAATEGDDQITRIDYYPTGLVSSTTLPDGRFTSYVYDAAHRLIDIVDAEGNRIHYTLDNAGNRVKEEVKGSDDTLKRTLSRVYNQLGQLQTAKDSGSHATRFTYDASGNLDTATDALGRVTNNDHDPLNRLSRTLQDVGGINAETRFHYDAQDNLTEVVDPKGLSTKYTYNAFGDLTKLESPDTGITTYGYDSAGNRTSVLDARGELARYGYDALNRLTSIGYSDASLDVAYSYDTVQPECTATESFAVGRLTRMNDGSGSTRYCYDQFGNLTRKVQVTNGQTFALRYAYTKSGQLSGMEYPDGTVVDYVRDGLGQVNEVGVALPGSTRQVLLTGASYNPFGPIAGWTFGNGRTMVRTLDLDYRPKAILSTGIGAGGLNLGYGWDAVGNMASLHTSGLEQPPKARFGYDALNRLTEFQDGPTGLAIEKYGYDATGNRTIFTNANGTQLYAYAAGSHRLTTVAGVPRSYDAAGNAVSIGGTSSEFKYNAVGRMSLVERDNLVAMRYDYNGKGEQVRKHLSANSAYVIYDEAGHWVGDYRNIGVPAQQVIWLDDLPVGVISNAQVSYIEPDHLGTPRVVIEPRRDVAVWSWDLASEAFGNSAPSQDPDADTQRFELDMRFPGQRYDAASGLNQNGYREYESNGRYTQSDPIGLRGGTSTYTYVASRPLTYSDPLGLEGPGWWNSAPFLSEMGSRHGQAASGAYHDYRGWRVWGHQRFPAEKNSFARHCTVSCILSKKYGTGFTRTAGYINEYQGFYVHDLWDLQRRFRGERQWAFQTDDLAANEEGFKCSNKQQCTPSGSDAASIATECEKCCTTGVMHGY
ncbi:RHS repeat protein [Lysobacter arenosi]|uniref:RHS repeat protein n=2 Tax=Lysobacter arenosi TaxID=2795387 RepID=A0ABX7RIQ8_9GAMM|nr:RHS repeat protein [Lysobacter arenosi]